MHAVCAQCARPPSCAPARSPGPTSLPTRARRGCPSNHAQHRTPPRGRGAARPGGQPRPPARACPDKRAVDRPSRGPAPRCPSLPPRSQAPRLVQFGRDRGAQRDEHRVHRHRRGVRAWSCAHGAARMQLRMQSARRAARRAAPGAAHCGPPCQGRRQLLARAQVAAAARRSGCRLRASGAGGLLPAAPCAPSLTPPPDAPSPQNQVHHVLDDHHDVLPV